MLYLSAQDGLYVAPGYNPVSALIEKPTGYRCGEAASFEVAEAVLLLETTRAMEAEDRKNATPGLYPIIATFLLTGGRDY